MGNSNSNTAIKNKIHLLTIKSLNDAIFTTKSLNDAIETYGFRFINFPKKWFWNPKFYLELTDNNKIGQLIFQNNLNGLKKLNLSKEQILEKDLLGYSALHYAVMYENINISKYFSTITTDWSKTEDECGRYPFFYLCYHENLHVAEHLKQIGVLNKDSITGSEDEFFFTVIDYCEMFENSQMLDYFKKIEIKTHNSSLSKLNGYNRFIDFDNQFFNKNFSNYKITNIFELFRHIFDFNIKFCEYNCELFYKQLSEQNFSKFEIYYFILNECVDNKDFDQIKVKHFFNNLPTKDWLTEFILSEIDIQFYLKISNPDYIFYYLIKGKKFKFDTYYKTYFHACIKLNLEKKNFENVGILIRALDHIRFPISEEVFQMSSSNIAKAIDSNYSALENTLDLITLFFGSNNKVYREPRQYVRNPCTKKFNLTKDQILKKYLNRNQISPEASKLLIKFINSYQSSNFNDEQFIFVNNILDLGEKFYCEIKFIFDLIQNFIDLNQKGPNGYTILFQIFIKLIKEEKSLNILEYLLDFLIGLGCDRHETDSSGKTLLHLLVIHVGNKFNNDNEEYKSIVEYILSLKINPNIQDNQNRIACHYACESKFVNFINVFMGYKLDPNYDFQSNVMCYEITQNFVKKYVFPCGWKNDFLKDLIHPSFKLNSRGELCIRPLNNKTKIFALRSTCLDYLIQSITDNELLIRLFYQLSLRISINIFILESSNEILIFVAPVEDDFLFGEIISTKDQTYYQIYPNRYSSFYDLTSKNGIIIPDFKYANFFTVKLHYLKPDFDLKDESDTSSLNLLLNDSVNYSFYIYEACKYDFVKEIELFLNRKIYTSSIYGEKIKNLDSQLSSNNINLNKIVKNSTFVKNHIEKVEFIKDTYVIEGDDVSVQIYNLNRNNLQSCLYHCLVQNNIEMVNKFIYTFGQEEILPLIREILKEIKLLNIYLTPTFEFKMQCIFIEYDVGLSITALLDSSDQFNKYYRLFKNIHQHIKQNSTIDDEFIDRLSIITKLFRKIRNMKNIQNQFLLPWKELEFVLTAFISIYKDYNENTNLMDKFICQLTLRKENVFTYLDEFVRIFDQEQESNKIDQEFFAQLKKSEDQIVNELLSKIYHFQKSKATGKNLIKEFKNLSSEINQIETQNDIDKSNQSRDDFKQNYINKSLKFSELIDDYESNRSYYSLNVILYHINVAISIDLLQNPDYVLAIQRSIQVIGEYIKNTVESPNISNKIQYALVVYTKHLKSSLKHIRNKLSHLQIIFDSIEKEKDIKLFLKFQSDLRILRPVIIDLLYDLRENVISKFIQKLFALQTDGNIDINLYSDFKENDILTNDSNDYYEKIKILTEKLNLSLKTKSYEEKYIFGCITISLLQCKNNYTDIEFAFSDVDLQLMTSKDEQSLKANKTVFESTSSHKNTKKFNGPYQRIAYYVLNLQKAANSSSRDSETLKSFHLLGDEIIKNCLLGVTNVFQNHLKRNLPSELEKQNKINKKGPVEHLNEILENRCRKLKRLLDIINFNSLELSYVKNKPLQHSMEFLLFQILEINKEKKELDVNIDDAYFPVLLGRKMRNYLAHGDYLLNLLYPANPCISVLANSFYLDLKLFNTNLELYYILKTESDTSESDISDTEPDRVTQEIQILSSSVDTLNSVKRLWDYLKTIDLYIIKYLYFYDHRIYARNISNDSIFNYIFNENPKKILNFLLKHNKKIDLIDKNYTSLPKKEVSEIQYQDYSSKIQYLVNYLILDVHHDMHDRNLKLIELCLLKGDISLNDNELINYIESDILGCIADKNDNKLKLCYEKMAETIKFNCYLDHIKKNFGLFILAPEDDFAIVHFASYFHHSQIFNKLIQDESNLNLKSKPNDITPLHISCKMGSIDFIKLLIDKGADTTVLTANDENILHFAVLGQNLECIKYLIDNKIVDFNCKMKSGKTILSFAFENLVNETITDELQKLGAKFK